MAEDERAVRLEGAHQVTVSCRRSGRSRRAGSCRRRRPP
jgi:hypothetical protein